MITVALVDDDALVRTGLRLILESDPALHIVGEAGDGREGLDLIRTVTPDVVLLDIRMPVLDGLDVLERLKSRDHKPAVIVLTTFDSDDHVLTALGNGASGFLLKDTEPDTIIAGIHAAHRGDPVLSPGVTSTLIEAATRRTPVDRGAVDRAAELTPREREIAVLMAQGLTNAQISGQLHLSLATVKANLTRVFDKLGQDNRVGAAMAVRDAGLLR